MKLAAPLAQRLCLHVRRLSRFDLAVIGGFLSVAVSSCASFAPQGPGPYADPILIVDEGEEVPPIAPVRIAVSEPGDVYRKEQEEMPSGAKFIYYDVVVEYDPLDYVLLTDQFPTPPRVRYDEHGKRRELTWAKLPRRKGAEKSLPLEVAFLRRHHAAGDVYIDATRHSRCSSRTAATATVEAGPRYRPGTIHVYPQALAVARIQVNVNVTDEREPQHDVYLRYDEHELTLEHADPAPTSVEDGVIYWGNRDMPECFECVFTVADVNAYKDYEVTASHTLPGEAEPLSTKTRALFPKRDHTCP